MKAKKRSGLHAHLVQANEVRYRSRKWDIVSISFECRTGHPQRQQTYQTRQVEIPPIPEETQEEDVPYSPYVTEHVEVSAVTEAIISTLE